MRDVEKSQSTTTGLLDIAFGKSQATFDVQINFLFTGDVLSVDMDSTVRKPTVKDPAHGFPVGLSMSFTRTGPSETSSAASADQMFASIHLVSKKPSHGIMSGTDAISIAIHLSRYFRCQAIEIYDASHIHCDSEKNYSLRKARILSKGSGWYESKGFRSIIEVLHPKTFQKTVGQLHTIPTDVLIEHFEGIDAIVRTCIVKRSAVKGLVVKRYGAVGDCEEGQATARDLAHLVGSVSTSLEILEKHKDKKTVGDVMDHVMAKDCKTAADLVSSLLPQSSHFIVLQRKPDGSEAPKMPMESAWIFAWRLVAGNYTRTLQMHVRGTG